MGKNLLADTDYTDGRDQRFVHSVCIGRVSKIECTDKQANIRVIMPDKLDHQGNPLITKPIPVLQISAGGKKSFAMPRIGQNVMLLKLPNSTSSYAALNAFYTTNEPPPVKDPKLDYCIWEGGHIEQYDANTNDDGTPKNDVFLTQDFKGGWKGTYKKDVNLNTTDSAKFNVTADGDMLMKSANGNLNVECPNGLLTLNQKDITLQGSGTITIQAPQIKLIGNIQVTGNITEQGVHLDSNGHHTNARALNDLEARVAKLEKLMLKTA